MQNHDVSDVAAEDPFSSRELLMSLGLAVLWVLASIVIVRLLLLPVQVV